ncbi:unnamed protein product [Ascophyllum nodosum]
MITTAAAFTDTTSGCFDASDGYCDSLYNSAECGYDGGDCCECTCVDGFFHECGSNGYDCIDSSCSSDDDDNLGLIIGCVVGAVIFIGIVAAVILCCYCCKKRRATTGAPAPAPRYAGEAETTATTFVAEPVYGKPSAPPSYEAMAGSK